MTPAEKGRELAPSIRGARARALSGIGHMPMVEAPDETIDALVELLRRG
jgi:pimeloyl-ACP methyl ester carboxylesterase